MNDMARKPFTGYHMTAILIGFFGIVIAVNIYMAKVAVGTFGGTVVDNSYVASQQYNEWLAQADREAELGWQVDVARSSDQRLTVSVTDNGFAGSNFIVTGKAEHPLGRAPARALRFVSEGAGVYRSASALPDGRWLVRVEVTRGDQRYRMIADVQ